MRKDIIIMVTLVIFLMSLNNIFAVSIESCKSGRENWVCDPDDICVCEISGDCTDGDLLVYKDDITDLLCAPEILGSNVDIFWEKCGNPIGEVKVRADCEEGQSSREKITISYISSAVTTTTSTTTTTVILCNYVCQSTCSDDNNPPFCYRRIPHGTRGCPGGTICCESIFKQCPETETGTTISQDETCPYECCVDIPGYEYKPCSPGLICINRVCRESPETPSLSLPRSLLFWVIVASLIPIIAFFVFIWKKDKDQNIPEF